MELAGLGGPLSALLAGDPIGAQAPPLPGRLGRGPGLLAAVGAVGALLTDPTAWLAWVVLAVIFSFWWPGFLLLARVAVFRLRIPLMMAAPILWVGLEYIRAHLLTGFPWYYLGHSQFRFLALIQVADVTSALGISFLIALVNAWCVDLLSLPLLRRSARGTRLTGPQTVRLWTVTLLVGGTLVYGAYRLSTAQVSRRPQARPVADQPAATLQDGRRGRGDPRTDRESHPAARCKPPRGPTCWSGPRPPIPIATSPWIRPPPAAVLARQVEHISDQITVGDWLDKKQKVDDHLHALTDAAGVPMLVGTLYYDHRPDGFSKYNTAALFEPLVRTIRTYHKIHLVPFGEFIPFLDALPWLTVFTPYRDGYVPTLDLRP